MSRSTLLFGLGVLLATGTGTGVATAQSFSNDSGGTVTFYGQLSPMWLGYDDGEKTFSNAVDNGNSNSRVGFTLNQPMGSSGADLGLVFETSLGAPQSSAFSQDYTPIWIWEKTNLRKFEVTFGGDFGKVFLGQGSMATDGVAERSLSGTDIAGYVNRPDTAGGYYFRETSGDLSDITIGDVFKDYDGSRRFRIRYDTPDWNGLSFRAAYGYDILNDNDNADYYDTALSYVNEAGDLVMDGGIGYSWKDDEGDMTETWMGSFALLHTPTGLNGTVATGGNVDSGTSYIYGKLGIIRGWWDGGDTALSVDYYSGTDFETSASASGSWGLQAVQNFDDIDLQAYVSYANYSFEDDIASYQDGASTTFGIRWRF